MIGAELRIDDYRTPEQLLDWRGTTDAEGRLTWATAPDQPVTLNIIALKDGLGRSVKLQADGTEQIVRLRKGADLSIKVQLRVVDAESGQPLENFEVWRRMQDPQWKPWGSPGGHGDFRAEILATDFQKGIMPCYRLQVRATGYATWTGDALYFEDGDQRLTVELAKGVSNAPDQTYDRTNAIGAELRRRNGVADTPELLRLGEAICRLLETGNVLAQLAPKDTGQAAEQNDALERSTG